jgi:hypothetical protein
VPKLLTQYRVFIGSPSGLDEERKCFRCTLTRYTALHSEPRGVAFHPVGWEDTLGGVGRPQDIINEDLKRCDFVVFVLHDHWGSPTGSGYTSGVEEEFAIASELYNANQIRQIALFFKQVDPRQIADPGKQLEMVLAFKQRILAGNSTSSGNTKPLTSLCGCWKHIWRNGREITKAKRVVFRWAE